MIERVRPEWSDEELSKIYATPHNHVIYGRGHGERVASTVALARKHLPGNTLSVADLSCGNAYIAKALACPTMILGDYAPGYEYTGKLETNLALIPDVDAYILSETLEHVNDPQLVLTLIRDKAKHLVLSTPLECWGDTNAEHYWAWDQAGVEELMTNAGWTVKAFDFVDSRTYGEPYLYGIWIAS